MKGFVALYPGCSRYHFWLCSAYRIGDWVIETELKVSQAPWKDHMDSLKLVLEVKDLKSILLAALIAPRGEQ